MPTFDLGKVIVQGPQGERGPMGYQGVQGKQGETGPKGDTPDVQIGRVYTIEPGADARVERREGSTNEAPVFDFWIPRGADAGGDMLKSVYDPDGKGKNFYAYAEELLKGNMGSNGGTFTGVVVGVSPTDGEGAFRNIYFDVDDPDDALGKNGDVYIKIAETAATSDGEKLSSLSAGSIVLLKEDSKDTEFIVLGAGHYATGAVTLLRKDCFGAAAFAAVPEKTLHNVYIGSTLDNFCDCIWPQKLDESIRDCIIPVEIVVTEGGGEESRNNPHRIYRKGFALSVTEISSLSLTGVPEEGTVFGYFDIQNYQERYAKRIAYLDGTTTPAWWGLRTPGTSGNSYYIGKNGSCLAGQAYYPFFAPRPAFNLDGNIVVESIGSNRYKVANVPGKSSGGVYVKQGNKWRPAV